MNRHEMNHIRLGLNIRRWRRVRNITQVELAKKMKCSAGMISAIERGQRRTTSQMMALLCQLLDCCMADLLRDVE